MPVTFYPSKVGLDITMCKFLLFSIQKGVVFWQFIHCVCSINAPSLLLPHPPLLMDWSKRLPLSSQFPSLRRKEKGSSLILVFNMDQSRRHIILNNIKTRNRTRFWNLKKMLLIKLGFSISTLNFGFIC